MRPLRSSGIRRPWLASPLLQVVAVTPGLLPRVLVVSAGVWPPPGAQPIWLAVRRHTPALDGTIDPIQVSVPPVPMPGAQATWLRAPMDQPAAPVVAIPRGLITSIPALPLPGALASLSARPPVVDTPPPDALPHGVLVQQSALSPPDAEAVRLGAPRSEWDTIPRPIETQGPAVPLPTALAQWLSRVTVDPQGAPPRGVTIQSGQWRWPDARTVWLRMPVNQPAQPASLPRGVQVVSTESPRPLTPTTWLRGGAQSDVQIVTTIPRALTVQTPDAIRPSASVWSWPAPPRTDWPVAPRTLTPLVGAQPIPTGLATWLRTVPADATPAARRMWTALPPSTMSPSASAQWVGRVWQSSPAPSIRPPLGVTLAATGRTALTLLTDGATDAPLPTDGHTALTLATTGVTDTTLATDGRTKADL